MPATTMMPNRPLPHKTARGTTRSQQATGGVNPNAIPAAELEREKNKKLKKRGSTYAAPPAPNPTAGNLARGTTRMGGY